MWTMEMISSAAAKLPELFPALDGSIESLEMLDALLAEWAQEFASEPNAQQMLDVVIAWAGAYFGEVLRKAAGGEWQFDEGFAPTLAGPGCTISPIGRVNKFFEEGPENSIASLGSAYVALNQLARAMEVGNA